MRPAHARDEPKASFVLAQGFLIEDISANGEEGAVQRQEPYVQQQCASAYPGGGGVAHSLRHLEHDGLRIGQGNAKSMRMAPPTISRRREKNR